MLGRVSTLKYVTFTTLLQALPVPVLQVPVLQALLLELHQDQARALPVPVLQVRVPRPQGLPVSVLPPFCSQLLQKIKSRRKAGKE